jgi:hypothetical protein
LLRVANLEIVARNRSGSDCCASRTLEIIARNRSGSDCCASRTFEIVFGTASFEIVAHRETMDYRTGNAQFGLQDVIALHQPMGIRLSASTEILFKACFIHHQRQCAYNARC